MSNSNTSPIQYPLPYKVINGCLYKEVTTKSGITTKKLSNFLPYIVKEVSVDDGAEEKYELRLGGIHSSGRLLPEIDVSGSELGNFNWLIERWGADCVLEPERSIKETVRHAIQLTAENAEKIHVYHTMTSTDGLDCLTVTNTTAPVITVTARIIARLTG